jgi:hypothetical protein
MTTTPAAIPTRYHDTDFRSRLEARWAIVLDRLGVRWYYEYEAHSLPSGSYLPDFWLPDISDGTWLEIKADNPPNTEGIERLAGELAGATGHDCMVAWGFPLPEDVGSCGPATAWPSSRRYDSDREGGLMTLNGPESWDNHYALTLCPVCDKVGIQFDARGARVCHSHGTGDRDHRGDDPTILAAYRAGWSARYDRDSRTFGPR